jgi:hypothetical protein
MAETKNPPSLRWAGLYFGDDWASQQAAQVADSASGGRSLQDAPDSVKHVQPIHVALLAQLGRDAQHAELRFWRQSLGHVQDVQHGVPPRRQALA